MKALTIWQPHASLIMIGAKPYEFRCWPAPRSIRGERIAIHAAARGVLTSEIQEIINRLDEPPPTLVREIAEPMLYRIREATRGLCAMPDIPLGAVLGTARLGVPIRCLDLFPGTENVHPDMWAWPLTEVDRWRVPLPARGAQGFWNWNAEVPV